MSAIPSGSSAGHTNTIQQERIEVRRSSLTLQTDYRITLLVTDPLPERDHLFLTLWQSLTVPIFAGKLMEKNKDRPAYP